MKKRMSVLLVGAAAVLATVILYFVILGNVLLEAIHFVCLLATVLAEVITTLYAFFSKGAPRKVAAAVLSGLMIPFAVVLSVVYILGFPRGYGTYLGIYAAVSVLVNALCMILWRFDGGKQKEYDALQQAKGSMLDLRRMVKLILTEAAAEPYRDRLEALEEELHYSNDCVIGAGDAQIRALLTDLHEKVCTEGTLPEEKLATLERLVRQRKILTSRTV